MICKTCGKEFFDDYRKDRQHIRENPIPKYCSKNCANKRNNLSFGTKQSKCAVCGKLMEVDSRSGIVLCDEHKNHAKIIKKIYNCKYCGKAISKTESGCCISCYRTKEMKTDNYRSKVRNINLLKIEKGEHKGWKVRTIRSYAEKFFEKVLDENGYKDKYKTEYSISKSSLGKNDKSSYFLDFYFPDIKFNLEVDGKQHQYDDRKESDRIRDQLLKDFGIEVYRIKWKSPNTESGKLYLKSEILKLLEVLNIKMPT